MRQLLPRKTRFAPAHQRGFAFAIIEIATGKVAFYLTGAANLLHANDSILDCAVSAPQIVGATTTYDVIWTERVAGVRAGNGALL